MRYLFLPLLLCVFMIGYSEETSDESETVLGVPSEAEMPRRVQRATQEYQEALRAAEQEYLSAVEEAQSELQEEIVREINRLRLSDEEDELVSRILREEEDAVKTALLEVAPDNVKAAVNMRTVYDTVRDQAVITDLLGNKVRTAEPPGHPVVGEWVRTFGQRSQKYVFHDDQTFTRPDGKAGAGYESGTWSFDEESGELVLTYANTRQETYTYSEESEEVSFSKGRYTFSRER